MEKKSGLRVIVCGGRDYDDASTLFSALDAIVAERGKFEVVINGAAPGADSLAVEWARSRGVSVLSIAADWGRYGLSAGPRRNLQLLEKEPDLVVAFPGGKGTAHMVQSAKRVNIEVVKII